MIVASVHKRLWWKRTFKELRRRWGWEETAAWIVKQEASERGETDLNPIPRIVGAEDDADSWLGVYD
jgi:hypothetical protein